MSFELLALAAAVIYSGTVMKQIFSKKFPVRHVRSYAPAATKINVAKQFSINPAGPTQADGPDSAYRFLHSFLIPAFNKGGLIEIELDGTFGYASNWLTASFGQLVRQTRLTADEILNRLSLVTKDNSLAREIEQVIRQGQPNKILYTAPPQAAAPPVQTKSPGNWDDFFSELTELLGDEAFIFSSMPPTLIKECLEQKIVALYAAGDLASVDKYNKSLLSYRYHIAQMSQQKTGSAPIKRKLA